MTITILSLLLIGAFGAEVEAQTERETFLYVTTNPPGAEVLVDGKHVGTTPGLFPFKPDVPRQVIVELDGHEQHKEGITIRAGDIKRLTLKLIPSATGVVRPPLATRLSPGEVLPEDATLEAILARLEKPPKGWKVTERLIISDDDLAKIVDETSGRCDYASRISLLGHGKKMLVDVYRVASGESLEKPLDTILRRTLRQSPSYPLACLTYGRAILLFHGPDSASQNEVVRELGFQGESQLPLWADLTKQHELRKRNHVQLVVDKERLTLEGDFTTWDELRNRLERIPDRKNTVLYISRTTDDWIISEWKNVEDKIREAYRDLGFESTSFGGRHPLGYRATQILRLVIAGKECMTLDGRELKQHDLSDQLLDVSDRYRTVLEICRAAGGNETMRVHEWEHLRSSVVEIANRLGFKETTYIGERRLGSKASTDSTGLEDGPRIPACDVKLNFAELGKADSGFHGGHKAAFPLDFNDTSSTAHGTAQAQLLIGQMAHTLSAEKKSGREQLKIHRDEPSWMTEFALPESVPSIGIIPIPVNLGEKEYLCPVQLTLERSALDGRMLGSYWFCAYVTGRLPSAMGDRSFEIVNLDRQMRFRDVAAGEKQDAALGVDVDGDGTIDPSSEGKETFRLYEPFPVRERNARSRYYVLAEVDPHHLRVVFREVASPGGEARLQNDFANQWHGQGQAKKFHLPNIEERPGVSPDDFHNVRCILDLASGQMLPFPDGIVKGDPDQDEFLAQQTQGDLCYAQRSLFCMRGARAMQWNGSRFIPMQPGNFTSWQKDASSFLTRYYLMTIPCRLLITTAEKKHFDLTILSITDSNEGIDLEYREAEPALKPGQSVRGDRQGQRLSDFVGYWRGTAVDYPEDGGSTDPVSFKLTVSEANDLVGVAYGEFVLDGEARFEDVRVVGDRVEFTLWHRTGVKMRMTMKLVGDTLTCDASPIDSKGDRCQIELTRHKLLRTPDEPTSDQEPAPSQVNEALGLIERNYIVGLDRPELIEAAIEGMVKDLDEHSTYINQDDLTALKEQLAKKLSGVGLALKLDPSTGELLVETPLPDTPAHRAGIHAGDTIVQIDGKPITDFPQGKVLQAAATLIRGRPGSTVTVGLKHAGADEVQQITLVREPLHLPAIKGDRRKPDGTWEFMLDEEREIGYIRLTDFGPQCANALTQAIGELRSRGMKALVLDLRNSPGGSLSQAIQVADLFVEEGVIVSVKTREDPAHTWFAKKEGTFGEFPMAVLVNRDSAGAAEIVAACLQDHGRAIIVGERTYGKGTAHRILELKSGDGALKLPTAAFLRPNGKGIHRFDGAEESDIWGVTPDEDCDITLPEGEYEGFLTYRRQEDGFGADRAVSSFVDRQLELAVERLGRSLSNQ